MTRKLQSHDALKTLADQVDAIIDACWRRHEALLREIDIAQIG